MYEVNSSAKEKAILVGVIKKGTDRWETADHLEELALLTDTAGAVVADKVIQEKEKIDPAFYVGRGKAENLSELAQKRSADLIIFDDDLSPAQIRNLERLSDKKILDRSGLILDIFASRAKTREAKTQVELAQLKYLLPRLTRQWTHLSRQVGGIGTRGPGETQLEVDRRLIGKRISKLSEDLVKIKNQRDVRRRGRELTTQVALVGYTNAGKSTLLNALTDSKVFVEDRLFATLDSTIRRMKADNHSDLLLIDTVGFIRKLPHNLVASFMSTLEEANKADVLLHVVDISHSLVFKQISVVKDVLNELKILNKPTIYVFNKIDKLEQKGLVERFKNEYEPIQDKQVEGKKGEAE
ncbi:GTPase HflX [candidate division KSB1 bacterium]|nr:GTPase HflX [candidate division KSB1 bacterium]